MRTTKLMALLLAALMVVTAFAGCASGVKQEAFDGLEDRVEALEGKIDGVDSSIKDLADKIPANDNKEQLDQITNTLDKIADQLDKVENRVTEVENKPTTGGATADAATKTAAQAANAKIEIKQNEFAKNADKYTEADYAAILSALGAAKSAVAAATTVAEVDKAMADLETALDQYMTYAMKAYDYYTQLLGNINADAEELVDEVLGFIDDVEDYYDGKLSEDYAITGKIDGKTGDKLTEVAYELAYLAVEGSKESKNEYIDIYNALKVLTAMFDGDDDENDDYVVVYVNEKGKVTSEAYGSLAYYEKTAETLVDDIDDEIGEELLFTVTEKEIAGEKVDVICDGLDALIDRYDAYVEDAKFVGGDKLVDLITNADTLAGAEDALDNLVDAADAFDEATYVTKKIDGDVFYLYDKLVALKAEKSLAYTVVKGDFYNEVLDYDIGDVIWVADEYEKVDDILADWIDTYDLSDENVNAIIAYKKANANYYTKENVKYTADEKSDKDAFNTYVVNKHYNDLLVAACDEFKSEIADLIEDLNGASKASVELALDFSEVEDIVEELMTLQEKDKNAEYPANIDLPKINGIKDANMVTILKEADLFADMDWDEDVEDERYAAIANVIDLFTFEADVDQLEDTRDGDGFYYYNEDKEVVTDNRAKGAIYKFFTETYKAIKNDAKTINDRIATFVEAVEDNAVADNLEAFLISGDYYELAGTATDPAKYNGDKFYETVYVALDDYLKDQDKDLEDFYGKKDEPKAGVDASDSIAAFLYFHADFKDLLDIDEYEKAKKTITDHIEALFSDIDAIVELVEDVDYVREGAVVYEEVVADGKYTSDDKIVGTVVYDYDKDGKITSYGLDVGAEELDTIQLVSLNDATAVKAAVAAYNKWVGEGGSTDIAYFGTFVDEVNGEYDDVFALNGLGSTAVKEINHALDLLDTLDAAIQALEEKADHFVKAVANAKAVQGGSNPFKVNLSGENHFATGTDVVYYAWISRTLSTSENTDSNAGSYKYVVDSKVWTVNTSSNEKSDEFKKDTSGYLNKASVTKLELVEAIVGLYDDFKKANIEYKADADNDYETEDAKVYYQAPKYAEFKAFEDAVKNYEAIDLLSVKGYILKNTPSSESDSAAKAFRARIINEAKDHATLQNFVYQYNLGTSGKIYAGEGALGDVSIYNFTRLPVKPVVTPTAE